MEKIRLDKFLSEMGIGSRSEVKIMLKKGMVTINGKTEKEGKNKIDPKEDQVCVQNRPVTYVRYEYIMFHKPAGCVSATEDTQNRTVLDFISKEDCFRKKELFPVGRLDKDTEGLLLLTNDGKLAHRLLSPRKHIEKKYFVRLKNEIGEHEIKSFADGINIGDEKETLPAKLEVLENPREAYVWITEGRYHQIKRMFRSCDNEVLYLKRLSMGKLQLDPKLEAGQYRKLTKEELESLC